MHVRYSYSPRMCGEEVDGGERESAWHQCHAYSCDDTAEAHTLPCYQDAQGGVGEGEEGTSCSLDMYAVTLPSSSVPKLPYRGMALPHTPERQEGQREGVRPPITILPPFSPQQLADRVFYHDATLETG